MRPISRELYSSRYENCTPRNDKMASPEGATGSKGERAEALLRIPRRQNCFRTSDTFKITLSSSFGGPLASKIPQGCPFNSGNQDIQSEGRQKTPLPSLLASQILQLIGYQGVGGFDPSQEVRHYQRMSLHIEGGFGQ